MEGNQNRAVGAAIHNALRNVFKQGRRMGAMRPFAKVWPRFPAIST
jgi:hypothetical protein